MPCPGVGPCEPWDLDLSCCLVTGALPDPCLDNGQPVSQEQIDSAILAASQFMWAATGRQFGCCQVTIRPTQDPRNCDDCASVIDTFGYPWIPVHLPDGSWTNVSCFCGEDPCGCPAEPCSIELPYPVCSIDQVKIDGQIIGKSLYRVDDFRKLVFTPGQVNVLESLDAAAGPIGGPIVAGPIIVTGLNAQAVAGGIQMSDLGLYQINLGAGRRDLVFEFEVTPGTFGNFNFPLAGGDFAVLPGDGHFSGLFDPPLQKTGINVQYSTPGDAGSTAKFFIVANDSGLTSDVLLNNIVSSNIPNGLRLISVGWSEPGAGRDCFPKCNDLSKTDDEVGTMSVTLTYGRPVPELVRRATAEFACQLIKQCVGAPCQLPQRLQSISRQGVTASFLDPMDFLDKGKTGIYLADLAIKTYNPNMLMQRARVYSPDSIGKWRVTTWENKPGGREDPFGPQCT